MFSASDPVTRVLLQDLEQACRVHCTRLLSPNFVDMVQSKSADFDLGYIYALARVIEASGEAPLTNTITKPADKEYIFCSNFYAM